MMSFARVRTLVPLLSCGLVACGPSMPEVRTPADLSSAVARSLGNACSKFGTEVIEPGTAYFCQTPGKPIAVVTSHLDQAGLRDLIVADAINSRSHEIKWCNRTFGTALVTKDSPDVLLLVPHPVPRFVPGELSLVWIDESRKRLLEQEYGEFAPPSRCSVDARKTAEDTVAKVLGPNGVKVRPTQAQETAIAALEAASSPTTMRARVQLYRDAAMVMSGVCSAPRARPSELSADAKAIADRVLKKVSTSVPTSCTYETAGFACGVSVSPEKGVTPGGACTPGGFRELYLAYVEILKQPWVDDFDKATLAKDRLTALTQVQAQATDTRSYLAHHRLVTEALVQMRPDLERLAQQNKDRFPYSSAGLAALSLVASRVGPTETEAAAGENATKIVSEAASLVVPRIEPESKVQPLVGSWAATNLPPWARIVAPSRVATTGSANATSLGLEAGPVTVRTEVHKRIERMIDNTYRGSGAAPAAAAPSGAEDAAALNAQIQRIDAEIAIQRGRLEWKNGAEWSTIYHQEECGSGIGRNGRPLTPCQTQGGGASGAQRWVQADAEEKLRAYAAQRADLAARLKSALANVPSTPAAPTKEAPRYQDVDLSTITAFCERKVTLRVGGQTREKTVRHEYAGLRTTHDVETACHANSVDDEVRAVAQDEYFAIAAAAANAAQPSNPLENSWKTALFATAPNTPNTSFLHQLVREISSSTR